jgi:hypothetical protein
VDASTRCSCGERHQAGQGEHQADGAAGESAHRDQDHAGQRPARPGIEFIILTIFMAHLRQIG